MVKTIEYSAGITTVDFSQARSYGASNRYYAVRNYGDSDIFISSSDTCAQGTDGTKRVPAGECRGIDMHGLNVLYVAAQGSGTAEIDTAAGISALGFNGGSKGGGSSGGVVTASGNPVQLDGLQGGVPFNEIVVSGKNLIPYPFYDTTKTVNGITFTDNGNGSITIIGTSTADIIFRYISRAVANVRCPKGIFTLSYIINGNFAENAFVDWGYTGVNGNFVRISSLFFDSDTKSFTNDFDDDAFGRAMQIAISIPNDTTVNGTIYVQMESGSTPTAYEPPITGRELTVGVSGKNLLKYPYYETTKTINGVTFTDNGDGTITANGTATDNARFYTSLSLALPIGEYTVSDGNYSAVSADCHIQVYTSDAPYTTLATTFTNKSFVLAEPTVLTVRIIVTNGNSFDNLVIKPQIELGFTATPYEPYHGADYTITPDSNPYTVPVDIIQQGGINVLYIADDSNPTISVSANKASEQLGMIFRTLDNAPVLLFDGTIPTSSSAGYAEFDLLKNCSILIIVPTLNDTTTSGTTYAAGNCTVLPVDYAGEEEREFTLYGYPNGTQCVSRGYIKRSGSTFSVRGSSTTCAHLTIYGI